MPIKRKPNAGLSHRRKYKYGSRQYIAVTERFAEEAGDEEGVGQRAGQPAQQIANTASLVTIRHTSLAALSPRETEIRIRTAIFYVYIDMLNASDPSQWCGHKGTVARIVHLLNILFTRRQVVILLSIRIATPSPSCRVRYSFVTLSA